MQDHKRKPGLTGDDERHINGLIAAIVLAVVKPGVAPFLVRAFAVLAIGLGVAGLVTGILFGALGVTNVEDYQIEQYHVAALIGVGAGLIVAGLLALILSFGGRKKQPKD